MVLSAEGHEITFAMNGNEGLMKLNSRPFDLVILDVVMPGKNGYQICREIKTSPQLKDIPVIMMTTKNLAADKFWGMRQGADEYIIKPCSEEALLRVANKYLQPGMAAKAGPPFFVSSVPAVPAAETATPVTTLKRKDPERIPAETVAATSSMTSKERTAEHPALPPEEKIKKKFRLKDGPQNPFYRFDN
jgi:twitching motility two-component system response regulator PilH